MSTEEKIVPEDLKKANSYTYWVDEKNKSRELPEQHKPKKIETPIVQPEKIIEGPSHWNKLGSWQQKAISMQELNAGAEAYLTECLIASKSQFLVQKVDLSGEFQRIYSNNKKKILFQVKGSILFEGEEDLQIKIQELSCSGDRDYVVSGKNEEERELLEKKSGIIIDNLLKYFNKYKE